jgi:gluconokinase
VVRASLASWTGMLNRATLEWDDEVLSIAGVRRAQLSPLAREPNGTLKENYRARWRALTNAKFFAAWGDGATANIGSGCVDARRAALTLGTSGAVRVVAPRDSSIPNGLWLYCVDDRRGLLGGSLNNSGNVFAYLQQILKLPAGAALEVALAALPPDAHGLTLLPFFAGERSLGYHGAARAALHGWSLNTTPVEILRAALEAIAYRVAAIYELLRGAAAHPTQIVGSGAALLNSPTWTQILADVLGEPLTLSGENEASARGAAVLALEALGVIENVTRMPHALGKTFAPNRAHFEIYARARERQRALYNELLEPRA